MVETVKSKGAHEKTKPNTVVDYNMYKIGDNKSDQMLFYHTKKYSEVVEELFFHLFDLALVNAHILHWKKYTKKFTDPISSWKK
jgi:hypothetical protein